MANQDDLIRALNRNSEITALSALLAGAKRCEYCGKLAHYSHVDTTRKEDVAILDRNTSPHCDACRSTAELWMHYDRRVEAETTHRELGQAKYARRLETLLKGE